MYLTLGEVIRNLLEYISDRYSVYTGESAQKTGCPSNLKRWCDVINPT